MAYKLMALNKKELTVNVETDGTRTEHAKRHKYLSVIIKDNRRQE